jgi:hypothetical protein
MAGNAVFFVERRTDTDREYLVFCHPQRTPPCARVAPSTIRDRRGLTAWLATEEENRRRVRPEPSPRVSRRSETNGVSVPLVTDEQWEDWPQLVEAPQPPSEEPPGQTEPGVGTVNVVTPGGWANVYDTEGHFLGQTPIQLRLRPGRHQISLRPFGQPPGDPDPIEVDVRVGETVSIVRRLDQTPDVVTSQ